MATKAARRGRHQTGGFLKAGDAGVDVTGCSVQTFRVRCQAEEARERFMTRPGFFTNPKVIAWLDGIEPAWTLLDFASISALSDRDPVEGGAIAFDLTAR